MIEIEILSLTGPLPTLLEKAIFRYHRHNKQERHCNLLLVLDMV